MKILNIYYPVALILLTMIDLLTDNFAFNNLYQINYITNNSNNILDLILTNCAPLFSLTKSSEHLVNPDNHHQALGIQLNWATPKIPKHKNYSTLNFASADYNSIINELNNISWSEHLKQDYSIDRTVDTFYELIETVITKYTPLKNTKSNSYPIWFSTALIKVLREKAKFHNRFKKYGNPRDYFSFQKLRERSDKMILECYTKFKTDAKELIKKNPKYF